MNKYRKQSKGNIRGLLSIIIKKKNFLSIKKKKSPLEFPSPHAVVVSWRNNPQKKDQREKQAEMFQHCFFFFFFSLDDIQVTLNIPEVVLFARSYRLAANPLGTFSFNAIAHSHTSCVSLQCVTDKQPSG